MDLKKKMAELEMIKENLKQAKDDATQSWLDSRPLIDELERKQAELSGAKDRVTKAEAIISELQAQLETIGTRIKSAKGEEERYHGRISDVNQAQHKTQEEMEQHKTKTDEKRRRKTKLKQVLRLKKQTLQALELTLEAVKSESEAFGTSAAQALHYISNSEAANVMIQLRQEEYDVLKTRASEEISTAEWRILASQEEKLASENSRDAAFARLQKLPPSMGYIRRNINILDEITGKEDIATQPAMGIDRQKAKVKSPGRGLDKIRSKVKSPGRGLDKIRSTRQQLNTNRNDDNFSNKRSICVQIKSFFVRKL